MKNVRLNFWIIALCINVMSTTVTQAQTFTTRAYEADESNIANPERGFYKHTEAVSGSYSHLDAETLRAYRSEGITLVLRVFYLTDFVSKDIAEYYLEGIKRDFQSARTAGVKIIVRFAYTRRSTAPYGDATPEWVLKHIAQLKPILQANGDVIAVVQAGFIGAWGEWYYTDHFSATLGNPNEQDWINRRALINALLDAAPSSRSVQVRTPLIKMSLLETENPLHAGEAHTETSRARLGHHNDCFLASADDYGTYTGNMDAEKAFLESETLYLPMGGETCNESVPLSECPNALAQMQRFHWSYLNRDYHSGVLGSWEEGSCMPEVVNSLGYRFRMTKAFLQNAGKPGGVVAFNIDLLNDGWANPFNKRIVELILRNKITGKIFKLPLEEDPRKWTQGDTIKLHVEAGLPANFPQGEYDLLLNLPAPEISLRDNADYSIHLANTGTWEPATGYNNLNHPFVVSISTNVPVYNGNAFFLSIPTVSEQINVQADGQQEEWEAVDPVASTLDNVSVLKIFNDHDSIFFLLKTNETLTSFEVFINTDPDSSSGSIIDPWNSDGADYRINENGISTFVDGVWSAPRAVLLAQNSGVIEIAVARDLFDEIALGEKINVAAKLNTTSETILVPQQADGFASYFLLLKSSSTLKATSSGEQVILYWAGSENQYQVIERSVDGAEFEQIAVLHPESFTFTDHVTGTPDVIYRSYLTTTSGSQLSAFTDTISLTPAGRPAYYVFTTDGEADDWEHVVPVGTADLNYQTQAFRIFIDPEKLHVSFEGIIPDQYKVYFDLDNDEATGSVSNPWTYAGFEYLISNDSLYNTTAGKIFVTGVARAVSQEFTELSVPLSSLTLSDDNTVIFTAATITSGSELLLFPRAGSSPAKFIRTLPAPAPANVTVNNSEDFPDTQLIIRWSECSDCDGIIVERSEDTADDFHVLATKNSLALSHYDNNLVPEKTYYYRVSAYNGAGLSKPSAVVNGRPGLPTGTQPEANAPRHVFPNPSSDFIEVELDINSQVQIINAAGQLVNVRIVKDKTRFIIDVSSLPPGLYVLRAHEKQTCQFKFIRR